MGASFLSRKGDLLVAAIKVIPGASHTAVQAVREGELVVRVAAAPEKGKANDELIAYLAKASGCPRSSFSFLSGQTARHKRLSVPSEAFVWLESLDLAGT